MAANVYDVIVIGAGGMGSAAAFELARRGRKVLALEQHPLGHALGSSHGHTRIIRQAYYEHPSYVPLVQRAFARWYDLEQRQGLHLLTECPCLSLGTPDSGMITGVLASARQHRLPVEELSHGELRRRYPVFHVREDFVGVLERSAGFLCVEECVLAHVREARRLGATVLDNEPVVSWEAGPREVVVQTARRRATAARLVLTAGPWAPQMLGRHGAPLALMRQVMFWVAPGQPHLFRRDVFPIWIAETQEGHFYGVPMLDAQGVKVARHYGAPEVQSPDEVERTVSLHDEAPIRAFLRAYLPDADGPCRHASVCIYTLTPDRHFIIDVHPEHANVALATGFSGHGFKFAAVVGEALADLAEEGRTKLPIEMFRISRFK
jgi:sarcosine oxidase